MGVLVGEGPIDHVRHRLEAPVGVPWGPLGFTGRVVHLAHLVHVHKGIEISQTQTGESPAHRNPSPSRPVGAVVTDFTVRSFAPSRPRSGTFGSFDRSSTVTAGMPPSNRFRHS